MSLQLDLLEQVDDHWAVLAVGARERDRGLQVANARLVHRAVGKQMSLDFEERPSDGELLKRLAMAYEMAAIEGLPAFLNPASEETALRGQCRAGAWRTYELRRLLEIPKPDKERVYHILHLSGLAYCGDRWSDLRRWFRENETSIIGPSVADKPWHFRLLFRLFDCWVRLFRKRGWDDLDGIREIVAGLRNDQLEYERSVLDSGSHERDRIMALRLMALYYWAKATELLTIYMLQGEPRGIIAPLDKHFESATEAATAATDAQLDVLMRWLHGTAHEMIAGSLWWVAHSVN